MSTDTATAVSDRHQTSAPIADLNIKNGQMADQAAIQEEVEDYTVKNDG